MFSKKDVRAGILEETKKKGFLNEIYSFSIDLSNLILFSSGGSSKEKLAIFSKSFLLVSLQTN
jgi:hypothetical protein